MEVAHQTDGIHEITVVQRVHAHSVYAQSMRPTRSYLICGVPRAGTSMLAGLLRSTDVAGYAEEYFWPGDGASWRECWGAVTDREFIEGALEQGSTPNGIFGARVMWGYLPEVVASFSSILGTSGLSPHEVLERTLPDLRYIHVIRKDRIAQAVSWAKAIGSGQWYSGDQRTPPRQATYDRSLIDRLVAEIAEGDRGWEELMARSPAAHIRVEHEEMVATPAATAQGVLRFLGVASDGVTIQVRTRQQADSVNRDWIRRYTLDPES